MDDPWQFARSEQRNKPPTTKNEFGAMKHFSPMYKYVWQWIISVALFNTGSGNPFVKGQLISEWNLVDFLGDLKTTKFHSEINWPLRAYCPNIYIYCGQKELERAFAFFWGRSSTYLFHSIHYTTKNKVIISIQKVWFIVEKYIKYFCVIRTV